MYQMLLNLHFFTKKLMWQYQLIITMVIYMPIKMSQNLEVILVIQILM